MTALPSLYFLAISQSYGTSATDFKGIENKTTQAYTSGDRGVPKGCNRNLTIALDTKEPTERSSMRKQTFPY